MSNPEELRKKFSTGSLPLGSTSQQQQQQPQQSQLHQISSLPISSTSSSGTTLHSIANPSTSAAIFPNALNIAEPERTYIFPGISAADGNGLGSRGFSDVGIMSPLNGSRGHARSVSHGGGVVLGPGGRPLKSAIKGHQRAFSQGQITDAMAPPRVGHSRVGSKTDFILPPGHKENLENREFGPSVISSARGHSRQASRSESIYTLRRTEIPPWWKRYVFCGNDKFEERGYRIVVPNHTVPPKTPKSEHPNGCYVGNKIRTTKYTLLSFIPKNLLEQFHRVANLYFIFIVLLNWFPAINAFGKEIAMIPVMFVLGVTAIKDLFEDRRRRASDKRINNSTCRVYNG